MTTVRAHQPIDLVTPSIFYGNVLSYDATHITISDGVNSATYFGSFTYSATGLSGGTVTAYDQYRYGVLAATIRDGSFDVLTINGYLVSGNAIGLSGYVLQFADTLYGSVGNDRLRGYGGNDVLLAAEGNDTLYGDAGNDVLDGGTGSDTMYGGPGDDTYRVGTSGDLVVEIAGEGTDLVESIVSFTLPANVERLTLTGLGAIDGTGNGAPNILRGNDGDNVLRGEGGNDVLAGAGGDDTLVGGDGADSLDGGGGTDTAHYAGSSAGITARLDLGWAIDAGGARDDLIGVENVIGTDLGDVLVGLVGPANVLTAGGGDDVLFFDAADTLSGGAGTDRAVALGSSGVNLDLGASSIEWLWGTGSADTANASGQTVTVTIFGLGGNDTITGGSAADQLYGQEGADTIRGGEGDDWLYIDGQDLALGSLNGGGGADRAASLDGSALSIDLAATSIEWVWASNLADALNGSAQAAALYLFAFDGADVLRGGSGADNLYGQAGADALYGGAGNDVLYFDSDDTVLDGGADHDTAQVLDYTGHGVTLDLGASRIEVVYASNQADTLDASSASWAVYMNGYNGDDLLTGGGGDDNIYGGSGADTISGGEGNDYLDGSGGPEIDTLVVSGTQAQYALHYIAGRLASVQDLVPARDGWDNVAGFERIQFTDALFVV